MRLVRINAPPVLASTTGPVPKRKPSEGSDIGGGGSVGLAGSVGTAGSVGRAGVSILTNVGLPELIARDGDDYIRIAAELAGDPNRVALYRRTLRDMMRKSSITNAAAFTRDVEDAYRTMWRAFTMETTDGNSHG